MQRQGGACEKLSLPALLCVGGSIVFLVLIGMTNLFHYTGGLDADTASEALFASVIWDSKAILPDTWYASTETRIISMPHVAALFYGMTHDMKLAAGCACMVLTVFLVVSFLYFGKAFGFTAMENLLFTFLCLALPAEREILEMYYLFASCYAVHVIVLFFTAGVYARTVRGEKKWGCLAAGMLGAFLLGLQGARGVLVIYAPLLGVELLRMLFGRYRKEKIGKADILACVWVVLLPVVSFLGMASPIAVRQEGSRNIRNGFRKLFSEVLPNVKSAVGLGSGRAVNAVCMAVLLLLTAFTCLLILIRMCRRQEITLQQWAFLLLFASLAVSLCMLSFTTIPTTPRYFFQYVFVMAGAVVLLFRKVRETANYKTMAEWGVCVLAVVLAVERFFCVYAPILKREEPVQDDIYRIARYLEDRELHTVYTTFENANVITVLTNGKIRGAAVDSVSDMAICRWLTSTEWYVPNVPFEEETAYVIPESMMEEFEEFLAAHGDDMKYETQTGDYLVYSSDYNFSRMDIY